MKETDEEKIKQLKHQLKTIQEVVILMIKGGCSKEYLEEKIRNLEKDFNEV